MSVRLGSTQSPVHEAPGTTSQERSRSPEDNGDPPLDVMERGAQPPGAKTRQGVAVVTNRERHGGLLTRISSMIGGVRGPSVMQLPVDQAAVDQVLESLVGAGLVEQARKVVMDDSAHKQKPANTSPCFDRPRARRAQAEAAVADSAVTQDLYHLTSDVAAKAIRAQGFKTRLRARVEHAGHGVYLKFDRDEAAALKALIGKGKPVVLPVKVSASRVGRVADDPPWKELRTKVAAQSRAQATASGLDEQQTAVLVNEVMTQLLSQRLGYDALVINYGHTLDMVVFDPRRLLVVDK